MTAQRPATVTPRFLRLLALGAALGLGASGLVWAVESPPALAAPGEDNTPAPNPDLAPSCGIDIHVVLDKSGSIASAGATNQVRTAFRAFTSALDNTGSRMAVSDFSTVADLPIPNYTVVTDQTIASTFEPYITQYNPSGSTNWEDGFRIPRYFAPRPDPNRPFLVLFMTDGNPNRAIRRDNVTYDPGNPVVAENQYELLRPLSSNQTQSFQDTEAGRNAATTPAISNSNTLKGTGAHVLAVAVGDGLSGGATLQRLQSVSGPNVYDGTGTFDIATTDVYRVADFASLEGALRDAAFQLCAPSVNIRKALDMNADPDVDDFQPGQGWALQATASPTPAEWVLPVGATGATANTVTDQSGFANFQWNTATPTDSTVSVTETPQAGFTNDFGATDCAYITPENTTPQPLPDFTTTLNGFSGTVPDDAIATCVIINRLDPEPTIDIEKSTNGVDADAAPGPSVPVGDPIVWTYVVTNTGNVTVDAIAVTDDQLGAVSCPSTSLPATESMTCTMTGVAVAGQYENTATVQGTASTNAPVSDTDVSHYFGAAAGIDIEKATNGLDADVAPGPVLQVGDSVTWTYTVTNTGNVPITGVTVVDDQGVTVTCPQDTLAVSESFECTATGTAVAGQYENTGTATGDAGGATVSDSDSSHYFGELLGITLEKTTNNADADVVPGPFITVGADVVWRYRFTNTGNVPLRFAVSDDQGVGIACPRILAVFPGNSLTCFGTGTAAAGQYANIGTVVGTSIVSENTVTATDPSHYFGVVPSIAIVKSTNGDDANDPPGPFIPVGSGVTWTYLVTNTGNSDLTEITVVDNQGVSVTCPQTDLAPGASMTCTASGTSQPDAVHELRERDRRAADRRRRDCDGRLALLR